MDNIRLKDSSDNYSTIEVISKEKLDRIPDPALEGKPYLCAIFGSTLHLYYTADQAYTLYYNYFQTQIVLENGDTVPFPEKIIEQVAYIYAKKYDQIDTTTEEVILEDMLRKFRRGLEDEGVSGSSIEKDPNIFGSPPLNYI